MAIQVKERDKTRSMPDIWAALYNMKCQIDKHEAENKMGPRDKYL